MKRKYMTDSSLDHENLFDDLYIFLFLAYSLCRHTGKCFNSFSGPVISGLNKNYHNTYNMIAIKKKKKIARLLCSWLIMAGAHPDDGRFH